MKHQVALTIASVPADLGVLGYVARGSGIDRDARRERPARGCERSRQRRAENQGVKVR